MDGKIYSIDKNHNCVRYTHTKTLQDIQWGWDKVSSYTSGVSINCFELCIPKKWDWESSDFYIMFGWISTLWDTLKFFIHLTHLFTKEIIKIYNKLFCSYS